MAVSIAAPTKEGVFGDLKYRIVDITFDSSYPTGGEALTKAQLGMTTVFGSIQISGVAVTTEYDIANEKLKAFRWNLTVAGSAAAAGTDALSLKAGVINKESAGAGTEQTNFAEVEDTTDLSAIVVRLIVFGK